MDDYSKSEDERYTIIDVPLDDDSKPVPPFVAWFLYLTGKADAREVDAATYRRLTEVGDPPF